MGDGEGPGVSEESRKWRKQWVEDLLRGRQAERMLAASSLGPEQVQPGLP